MILNPEKVGKFIKKIRKDNNLTQQKLADKYGVKRTTLYVWSNKLLSKEFKENMVDNRCKDLSNTKEELLTQIDELKQQVFALQLEKDVLEKANELL